MRLYSGTTSQLIEDTTYNRISTKLADAFFQELRYHPGKSEVNSWRESLRAMSQVFQTGKLLDNGVLLELQLPNSSMRLDCLVTGKDQQRRDTAVIVELKQWEKSEESAGANEVVTWLGGKHRDLLHPSAQVGHYKMYLEDNHTAFDGDSAVDLHACAYLHNYVFVPGDALQAEKFSTWLATYPAFSGDDVDGLVGFLQPKLGKGDGASVLGRIDQGSYRPSKKLLNHVASLIQGAPEYILLDEQLVAYDRVMQIVRTAQKSKRKAAILIKGGPGTGKSLIAMNLIGSCPRKALTLTT